MNKKIFTSLIVLTNFLGFNAYAAIDENNQDSKRGFVNENVGTESPQAIIAGDGSTQIPPNTDITTYIGANEMSKNAKSTLDKDFPWGETAAGPYYCYKNPEGGSNCMNCPMTNDKCEIVPVENIQEEAVLTVPTGTNLNASGFLDIAQPSVLFDQGYGTEEDGYKKYFYRYWNTVGDSTEGGEKEGTKVYNWSPSLPQVCFDTFNYNTFKNDVQNDVDKAKNYFGERKLFENKEIDEKNSYEQTPFSSRNRYSVHAKIEPEEGYDVAGRKIATGLDQNFKNEQNLNVYAWTKDGRLCLDPNFTPYKLRHSQGNDGEKTYFVSNINNISSINNNLIETNVYKTDDPQEFKLPCGMFTKTNMPSGYSYSLSYGTSCTENNVLRERNGSGLMYTKFKVKLPKPNGKYEDAATHDLNVRACVQCRSISSECRELVYAMLESVGCTKVNDKYSCSVSTDDKEGQLEQAIRLLRTKSKFEFKDSNSVSEDRKDLYYHKALTCNDGCLNQIEGILNDIF